MCSENITGTPQHFTLLWRENLLVYFVMSVYDRTQTSVWGNQRRLPGGGRLGFNSRDVQLAQATQSTVSKEGLGAVAGVRSSLCACQRAFIFSERSGKLEQGKPQMHLEGTRSRMKNGQKTQSAGGRQLDYGVNQGRQDQ